MQEIIKTIEPIVKTIEQLEFQLKHYVLRLLQEGGNDKDILLDCVQYITDEIKHLHTMKRNIKFVGERNDV